MKKIIGPDDYKDEHRMGEILFPNQEGNRYRNLASRFLFEEMLKKQDPQIDIGTLRKFTEYLMNSYD